MHTSEQKAGFTLLEFLIVVALVGILATLTVLALRGARRETRDAERVSTASQLRVSLELGFAELANYPVQKEGSLVLGGAESRVLCEISGVPQFVTSESMCNGKVFTDGVIASAPLPADGACTTIQNAYQYIQGSGGTDFAIEFCIGKATPQSGLVDGLNCVTPRGLIPGACGQ